MIALDNANLALGWRDLLGLSAVGALVTTAGTLLGLVLKDWVFARSFEKWRTRHALEAAQRKYRDPIVLSALELFHRLAEVLREYPTDFLASHLLGEQETTTERSAIRDRYFRQYKLQSSVFRLCAFLGWLELYRQELVFLESGRGRPNRLVEDSIRNIRADLADGTLNGSQDWYEWTDALIYREEQRAIGEVMITDGSGARVVLGYAQFSRLYKDDADGGTPWIATARSFFLDPEPPRDFRLERMRRLVAHLVDLVESLDPARISDDHRKVRAQYRNVTVAA